MGVSVVTALRTERAWGLSALGEPSAGIRSGITAIDRRQHHPPPHGHTWESPMVDDSLLGYQVQAAVFSISSFKRCHHREPQGTNVKTVKTTSHRGHARDSQITSKIFGKVRD